MAHELIVIAPDRPRNPDDLLPYLTRRLEPYSLDQRVAPYRTPCGCGEGPAVRRFQQEIAQRKGYTGWESMRALYVAQEWTTLWERAWEEVEGRRDETLARLGFPVFPPVPECPDCQGTGSRLTSQNPEGRWEWWVMENAAQSPQFPRDARLEDVGRRALYLSYLTPDGTWHAPPKALWDSDQVVITPAWEREWETLFVAWEKSWILKVDYYS